MAGSVLITIRFITPAEFGVLALLNNLTVFIPIIFGLGLRQVLAIEFFSHKQCWKLVWELTYTYLIFALPTGLLLVFNLDWLNLILFANQINPQLLLLVIGTSLLNFFPELLFQLLRFQNQASKLAAIQIGMGVILASLTSYLLYFSQFGLASVLIAQLITQGLSTSYFAYLLAKNNPGFAFPGKQIIANYLKTGLPFVPNIILFWLILACNRWMLNWQLDLSQVGIYSLSENLSLIFQTVITQPLMHSFLPHAFKQFAQNPTEIAKLDRQYQSWAVYFIIFLACAMPLGFYLFKPLVCWFLPAKYLQALPLLVPLLIAQVVLAGTYLSSASIQYLKKTHFLMGLILISACLAILINLLLMPTYHAYSCVIATNSAYLSYFCSIWLLKRYVLP